MLQLLAVTSVMVASKQEEVSSTPHLLHVRQSAIGCCS
jgi:hypothetical protein